MNRRNTCRVFFFFYLLRFCQRSVFSHYFNSKSAYYFYKILFFCKQRLLQCSNSNMHFRVCTKTKIVYGKAYSSSSINLFLLNYIYVDFMILLCIHNSRKNNKQKNFLNQQKDILYQ